jgi:hypothetical protein
VLETNAMKRSIILLIFLVFTVQKKTEAQKTTRAKSHATLTQWMDLHSNLVREAKNIPHVAYSRHFAYTAIAAYESIVHNHPRFRTLKGQLEGLQHITGPSGKTNDASSLNAAYAFMMKFFYGRFGNCQASIDSLELLIEKNISKQHIDATVIDNSRSHGRSVAASVIEWASKDGSDVVKSYVPLTGEGLWRPSTIAATPFWSDNRSITPGALESFSLISPVYTPDTASSFYKMAKEVYDITTTINPFQKETALYWDDSPNGKYKTVFGHWTSILSGITKQKNSSLIEAAEVYCKMTIAMYDASLLAWKGKYQYHVLRPITYIQKFIDPDWQPLIATPPHPEFPAAHATLSQAAATALCSGFGESCRIRDNSYTDIGMAERTYNSIREAAREAGMSRMYGGIHYRYSIEKGFELGEKAARHMMKTIQFRSQ